MQSLNFSGSSGETRAILRKSEERFRLLVEGCRDYVIFMLDAKGRVTTWNPGTQRIEGYEVEGIVGSVLRSGRGRPSADHPT
jgi:PAS domain S-box-containing protein